MLYDYLELGYDPEAVEAFQNSSSNSPFTGSGVPREPQKSKFNRRVRAFHGFQLLASKFSNRSMFR